MLDILAPSEHFAEYPVIIDSFSTVTSEQTFTIIKGILVPLTRFPAARHGRIPAKDSGERHIRGLVRYSGKSKLFSPRNWFAWRRNAPLKRRSVAVGFGMEDKGS